MGRPAGGVKAGVAGLGALDSGHDKVLDVANVHRLAGGGHNLGGGVVTVAIGGGSRGGGVAVVSGLLVVVLDNDMCCYS